ncbi:hypothetical protein [Synechococcus sp. WH 8020]|nr:hypothetical protein [Synechococcus sp. WH 8020]
MGRHIIQREDRSAKALKLALFPREGGQYRYCHDAVITGYTP